MAVVDGSIAAAAGTLAVVIPVKEAADKSAIGLRQVRLRLFGDGRRTFTFSGTIDFTMEKTVNTLAEFESEATRFADLLTRNQEGATLVTLRGELGVGKTAFTKAVARSLGVEEIVNSPTFVLEKIYLLGGPTAKFKRLIHIDAYRLEKGGDLAPLGFDRLMQDAENLILLEWPEKVADVLPVPTMKISLTVQDDDSRIISYG